MARERLGEDTVLAKKLFRRIFKKPYSPPVEVKAKVEDTEIPF